MLGRDVAGFARSGSGVGCDDQAVRLDPARRYDRITPRVLDRLSEIAAEDREDRFKRRPRWEAYRDRVLCVALCQGAALHYVDGRNGVKDLDVWTFFAEEPEVGPFPARWRLERRFDLEPFNGHFVDLIGRSLPKELGDDPVVVVRRYRSGGATRTARALARKAVVLLDPEQLRGKVVWSPSR
jgi:hypothetical protein